MLRQHLVPYSMTVLLRTGGQGIDRSYSGQQLVCLIEILEQHRDMTLVCGPLHKLPELPVHGLHDREGLKRIQEKRYLVAGDRSVFRTKGGS